MKADFTQLPNEVLEILMSSALFSTEKSIIAYICRQTFGYHRKTAPISRREFNRKLGISYRSINYALARLELVHLIAQVHRGSSALSFSEWLIDTSDYPQKLVHCSALDKTGTKKVKQLVHYSSQTSALVMPTTEPVNKSLNKAAANSLSGVIKKLSALLKDSFKYESGKAYRLTKSGWVIINSPIAYLASIEKNNSVQDLAQNPEPQVLDGSTFHYRTAKEWKEFNKEKNAKTI